MLKNIKKIWKELTTQKNSDSKWVTVLSTGDIYYSSIYKNALENERIPVMVIDQRDSSYNTFGLIHIQVLKEDVIKAQKILNSPDE